MVEKSGQQKLRQLLTLYLQSGNSDQRLCSVCFLLFLQSHGRLPLTFMVGPSTSFDLIQILPCRYAKHFFPMVFMKSIKLAVKISNHIILPFSWSHSPLHPASHAFQRDGVPFDFCQYTGRSKPPSFLIRIMAII